MPCRCVGHVEAHFRTSQYCTTDLTNNAIISICHIGKQAAGCCVILWFVCAVYSMYVRYTVCTYIRTYVRVYYMAYFFVNLFKHFPAKKIVADRL
jgi:hypothetical protein